MKQLLLVRHAKSSWDDFSIKDFDRPLNDRGKHDAPMMAKRLLKKKVGIDAFISSPAKRAKKTAELFAKEYGVDKESIIIIPELYLATIPVFADLVKKIDDRFQSITLFSHNEGITEYANTLTNTRTDNMPTCSIFAVRSPANSWSEFEKAEKEFWFFEFPKKEDHDA